jgi:hypothetical protein
MPLIENFHNTTHLLERAERAFEKTSVSSR